MVAEGGRRLTLSHTITRAVLVTLHGDRGFPLSLSLCQGEPDFEGAQALASDLKQNQAYHKHRNCSSAPTYCTEAAPTT